MGGLAHAPKLSPSSNKETSMHFAHVRAATRCFMSGRIALLGLLCLAITACGGGGELAMPSTDATGVVASDPGSASPPTGPGASDPGSTTPPAGSAPSDPGSATPPVGSGPSDPSNPGSGNTPSDPFGITPTPIVVTLGDMTKTYGDSPFQLASPVPGQDGMFTYSSSNAAVAQISGNTVTIVGAGITTLKATQTATGQSATATLLVKKAAAGLNLPTVTLVAGSDFTPVLFSTKSDGALTWSLSDVVMLGEGGLFPPDPPEFGNQVGQIAYLYPGSGPGTATVTVTQAPTANYEGATVSAPLITQKRPTQIALDESRLNLRSTQGAATFRIPIQISEDPETPGESLRPAFATVSDPSVATATYVNAQGYTFLDVYVKLAGVTTVTVSAPETATMAAATRTFTVTVDQTVIQQRSIVLDEINQFSESQWNNTYVPGREPAVILRACATGMRNTVGIHFDPASFPWPTPYAEDNVRKLVKISLYSDIYGELPMPAPIYPISIYPNTPQKFVISYTLPAIGGNFVLRAKVASWSAGPVFYAASESNYSVRLVLTGDEDRDCWTSGNH